MGRQMQPAPRQYDEAKLESMNEPLTVRVERLRNNTRSLVPLPEGEQDESGQARPGGTGWTKDDVRKLEQWLVTQWAGGGLFEVQVTDSSEPNQIVLKWQPYWDPKVYPERLPPTLADAVRDQPSLQPPSLQPQPLQVRSHMSAFPNGFPAGLQSPTAPYTQIAPFTPLAPNPYFTPPSMPAPPAVGTPQWHSWQQESDRRQQESELRVLRERDVQRERDAIAAQHKADLDRERITNEQRYARQEQSIGDLRSMITSLGASIKELASVPKGPSPEIEALKIQAQQARELAERERSERETERRDRETRDLIRSMNEATQRQVDALARLIEQTQSRLEAAAANKNDPLVSMLTEQSRQHAETMRELSRNQTEMVEKLGTYMMSPKDMIDFAQRSTAAADNASDRVTSTMGRILDMQQRVTENAMQLQPQGAGVVDVIRDGLNGFKEFGEKWVNAKTTSEKLAAASQVQIAQAAAQMAHAQAAAQQPALGQPPAAAPAPVKAETQPEAAAAAPPKRTERLWGRTDEEWFGVILDEVNQLRDQVKNGLPAEDTANGILIATGEVMKREIIIPAMVDLLVPGQLVEFMAVLLPNAEAKYRDEVVGILIKGAQAAHGVADVEDVPDPDGNEDLGEDDRVSTNGAKTGEAKPVGKPKAGSSART